MDHVHTEDQRNTQAAFLYSQLLYIPDALYPFEVEETAHLSAGDLSGDVAALRLSGDDLSGNGQIELPDLLFQRHPAHQVVDEAIHISALMLGMCPQAGTQKQTHH